MVQYKLQKKKKTSDTVYMNPITENQHQENFKLFFSYSLDLTYTLQHITIYSHIHTQPKG